MPWLNSRTSDLASRPHDWFAKTAIAICICMGATVAPAFAQEVKQQTGDTVSPSIKSQTTDADNAAPETPGTTETKQPSLSAQEQELDTLLLGPWARMTGLTNTALTNDVINKAVARCKTTMQLSRLNFNSDVVRALPTNTAHLVGDIVYYRTPKGIQSLDNRNDTLILLPKVEKTTTNAGRVVWHLTNNRFRVLLRFTNTSNRGGTGEFVATNDGIYLRCIRSPATASQ